ncbi:MAG: hypothetical protein ABJH45_22820 [Paracoccaceae bacterium]
MRFNILGLALLCAACAPQYTETRLEPGQSAPVNEARFTEQPERLFQAFEAACDGPKDVYTELRDGSAQCRILPPPDVAAPLLLRFDGALEIPYIFIKRRTRKDGDSFIVTFDYFASVPLKTGNQQKVYLRSPRIDQNIDQLFQAFGGTPI